MILEDLDLNSIEINETIGEFNEFQGINSKYENIEIYEKYIHI